MLQFDVCVRLFIKISTVVAFSKRLRKFAIISESKQKNYSTEYLELLA